MHHVTRGIAGFWALLLCACVVRADALEEAARVLGRKVAARVPVADAVHITERNLSSLPSTEAVRARVAFERSLRRAVRMPAAQEITVTLSESAREFLLIAEIAKGDLKAVEMVTFRPAAENGEVKPLPPLTRRAIWEQDTPLLDVVETSEGVLVAGVGEVALYARQNGKRERVRGWAMPPLARDARANLQVDGAALRVVMPGKVCTGEWRPVLALECASGGGENNAYQANGWPPYFSMAQLSNGVTLVAETDGRAHVYDGARKPVGVFGGLGSDLAAVCGTRVLASSDRERDAADTLRVYEIASGKPVAVTAALELPGPVMGLRGVTDGAVAVVRDGAGGKYVAYHVAVDCAP